MKNFVRNCKSVWGISLLLAASVVAGCTDNHGRRNDLRPLTENSFDGEYQQHIVITDDSVKPFDVVENNACLHVELPQKMTETCLDTVFSSYTFVPLETREECLIGQITKIIKCPGCYCILDHDNANVFLFEEDGGPCVDCTQSFTQPTIIEHTNMIFIILPCYNEEQVVGELLQV